MSDVLEALAIAVAGGVGAALRYVLDNAVPARARERFPWGTVVVNLTGSFVLGLAAGWSIAEPWGAIVTTGLLGGYTTFSTSSIESIRLLMRRRYAAALVNGPGLVAACAVLALAGISVTA